MVEETSEKMIRTSITLPESLKRKMDEKGLNWSAIIRATIRRKLDNEQDKNIVEAILLNEKLRRRAPKGWDSAEEIRRWRNRRQ
jgi:hypothetical protein